nr:MAG TPA: hypothetical protein [Caudoviricetes sp.]
MFYQTELSHNIFLVLPMGFEPNTVGFLRPLPLPVGLR